MTTVTPTPSLPQYPKNGKVQLVNGHGTTFVTAYSGGTNGSKVVGLSAVNTDTVSHTVYIAITRASVNYLLGAVTVGANAGNAPSADPVNLLSTLILPVDSDGNPFVFLNDNNDTLTVSVSSPVALATALNLVSYGADW